MFKCLLVLRVTVCVHADSFGFICPGFRYVCLPQPLKMTDPFTVDSFWKEMFLLNVLKVIF